MPSPLGHALGGFVAGWLVAGPPASRAPVTADGEDHRTELTAPPTRSRPSSVARALTFAALGVLADLDLLVGRHSQFTHSVGAALCVLVIALGFLRGRRGWVILAVAATAAYASHPLLDWLAQDATPPRGITALWPFSREYYLSHADIFWGISREPWRPGVIWHDLVSVLREVALLGPLAIAAWWLRRDSRARQDLPTGAGGARQVLPPPKRFRPQGESGTAK